MTQLAFELSRSDCGEALHVRCPCCDGKSCMAAAGLSFEDEDFHKGAPYACLAAGRASGLSDDQATAAALEALDKALEAGPVEELAPGESRTVDGPTFWGAVLTRMGLDLADPAPREALRERTAAALAVARTIRPTCAEGRS